MAGEFTRRSYDPCALSQETKQSTGPLELVMDLTKYVNCNNLSNQPNVKPMTIGNLVDVESSMWGLDRPSSLCNSKQYPFCASSGCLLTSDPRIPTHITPYASDRGHRGDKAVITTNMVMPTNPGYTLPSTNICGKNGYYSR